MVRGRGRGQKGGRGGERKGDGMDREGGKENKKLTVGMH